MTPTSQSGSGDSGAPLVECLRCGFGPESHSIFHDEPPADHGLTAAEFASVEIKGMWCPPDLPDIATCKHCGERILWDDYGYVHERSGFADCGLVIVRTGLPLPPPFDKVPDLHDARLEGEPLPTSAEPRRATQYGGGPDA